MPTVFGPTFALTAAMLGGAIGDIDRRVEQGFQEVLERLDAGQFDSLDPRTLSPAVAQDGRSERIGSKPLLPLQGVGRQFVFKLADPALAAAEVAAYELRRLGGRPGLPARAVSLDLPELGPVSGLLKPHLVFDATAELDTDTRTWSELQRAVMLLEHAWEWFLDNLDTNTSQYALLGPRAVPVNIDWDRAFFSDSRSELSRFAKYKSTLPNARTFLYADFVEGKIELPFALLIAEARRIRRLPRSEVRQILERFAEARFSDVPARRRFVARTLGRQKRIEQEAARLVRDLTRERIELSRPAQTAAARVHQLSLVGWDQWQLVLNAVLRGPIGKSCRSMLRSFRGLRHRRPRSA